MWLRLLILSAVIGANNFSASLALGALGQEKRLWRILLVFAVFEFWVPLIGLWLGRSVASHIAEHTEWLGPFLLAVLGVWTLLEATRETRDRETLAKWLTSWSGLFVLGAGLSTDNLVVGFSLGLEGLPPILLATSIMICSVTFSWIALRVGGRSRRNYETPTEVVSGLLLIGVAWAMWSGLL